MSGCIQKECFVIMPIESERKGYETNHFHKVYEQLIKPAIENAGMMSFYGKSFNNEKNPNMRVVQKIINSPVVVCDLSSLHPLVYLGLGIRRIYRRPMIILWDDITPRVYYTKNMVNISYSINLSKDNIIKAKEKIKISILNLLTSLN
jgi:hypothetical protein